MQLYLTIAMLAISACGPSYAGTWSGTTVAFVSGQNVSSPITLVVEQHDVSVKGTWKSDSGRSSGTMTGTAEGTKVDPFILTISDTSTCPGTLTGSLVVSGNTLTGSVHGTTQSCGDLNQTFTLQRD